ncbi:hypothetical protein MPTK1_6g01010 [Marchantia polymorpha subsp. ruderalis]|uniref:Uncharacterized protein n=2 Tax=Marchantia polymorpha TaxID=3197 RepID=A0AAF6BM90_MARPO|nr:hypothetical protein MARPO_0052s0103 [Marchantia polymorpha]BBN13124.1 hypothetical protein Mp_6g01010 [Marchantia polymorpha subsp. ruderalis]|eukprot:PTQ38324.1 hypothetical protein MARPO_0052s0103 [Marchantia polymorpha]
MCSFSDKFVVSIVAQSCLMDSSFSPESNITFHLQWRVCCLSQLTGTLPAQSILFLGLLMMSYPNKRREGRARIGDRIILGAQALNFVNEHSHDLHRLQ